MYVNFVLVLLPRYTHHYQQGSALLKGQVATYIGRSVMHKLSYSGRAKWRTINYVYTKYNCMYTSNAHGFCTHTYSAFVPSQTPVWGRPTRWSHVCWVCLLQTVHSLHSPARPTGWEQQPTPHVKPAWSFTSCTQPWYTAIPARIQYYLYVRLKAHVHMHTNRKCCRWLHVTSTYVHSIELYVSAYSTYTYGVACFWLHATWKSWTSM